MAMPEDKVEKQLFRMKNIMYLLVCSIIISCGIKMDKNSPFYNIQKEKLIVMTTIDNNEYWEKVNPVNFIDTLIFYRDHRVFVIKTKPEKGWYDEYLISEIEKRRRTDTLSCAIVVTFNTIDKGYFTVDCGENTVNHGIDYLIEGIKQKKYPYSPSSSCYPDPDGASKTNR